MIRTLLIAAVLCAAALAFVLGRVTASEGNRALPAVAVQPMATPTAEPALVLPPKAKLP